MLRTNAMQRILLALALLLWPSFALARPVQALKVTVLSTMLSDDGVGEWGYAALVEVDGRRILFDTGAKLDTVLRNAELLHIDLSTVEDVVLSHNHPDHTGGLLTLRRAVLARNPAALSRVHVAGGFFQPWTKTQPSIFADRPLYEATGGRFVEHSGPAELAPGVWLTGPVPRHTGERNYSAGLLAGGAPADDVPDDQALLIETSQGTVLITGCGHAGIINIVDDARAMALPGPVFAVIGGLHLYEASDQRLAWTAEKLKAAGLRFLLAGHCTGIEPTMRLRAGAGLTRAAAVYGGVGASFTLGKGIDPGVIGR
jgi:7,8-dihydropterin-6-yl-methyl-4-(beta-D-ribofuranosyl)aminobenzene 5'-phosphate synthase